MVKRWCNDKCREIADYVIARAQEPSTYRGLILIATAIGTQISPATQEAIIAFGLIGAGLVGVIFSDSKKRTKPND